MSVIEDRSKPKGWDLDELTKRCIGRLDLVDRVLGKFEQAVDRDLQELEQAVQAGSAEEIARLAHRIKGTSLTIAAHGLQEHAHQLEESAGRGDLVHSEDRMAALKQERSELDALISEYQASRG